MNVIARFVHRYAIWVVGAWVLVAVVANVYVPQLEQVVANHDQPFLPADAPSSLAIKRSARALGQTATDNAAYVVLERAGALNDRDRAFYDHLIATLRKDPHHVTAVVDWWSDPMTAEGALSKDRNVVVAMLSLSGMLGTTQANSSVAAVRDTVARSAPPAGLRVYVTGPGATIVDEFAAIDRQTFIITAATIAALLLLLLIVYRSLITAMIPMVSVGLALSVARPIVATLGGRELIGVSMFSVALSAAVVLGTGTDFAIFLIGRYHERRRQNTASATALADAYRGVTPVIVGSALTVAAALACLSFARISMFRTTGIPCSIGVLTAMVAALTLTPSLIALADRADLLRPQRSGLARRWRRIGVAVARWPGPILVASSALVLVLAIPLLGFRIAWDEPAATPTNAESNRGYRAVDEHFAPNQLLPDVVTIETDHDIRNSAGLINIERITSAVMAIPGVRMVQSATRPDGTIPRKATLTVQAGNIGDRLDNVVNQLTSGQTVFHNFDGALGAVQTALDSVRANLQRGTLGAGQMLAAADQLQSAMNRLRDTTNDVSTDMDPIRQLTDEVPGCSENPVCSPVQHLVQWTDSVTDSSNELRRGAEQLTNGMTVSTTAANDVANSLNGVAGQLRQARSSAASLNELINSLGTPLRELSSYLHELDAAFHGGPGIGFYIPAQALTDPAMRYVLENFMSPNGQATVLIVYGDGHEWSPEGAQRARVIATAIHEATKEGPFKPTAVELAGVGPSTRDLQALAIHDAILVAVITFTLIFAIVVLLLRSPVAGFVVVGTVTASYASALGASVLIWQYLIGRDLHWPVAPIAFMALVSVGSDYNLLLSLRIREELPGGPRTSMARAFAATGGVVTTAGLVFGLTMFALAAGSVLSVAQIGVTIGIGVVLDTLVVRSLVLPATIALLGRWFWWPRHSSAVAVPIRK